MDSRLERCVRAPSAKSVRPACSGVSILIALIVGLALGGQAPGFDAVEYVRAHRSADAALLSERFSEARLLFERCLELSPLNPTIAYGLACTEARSGNSAAALDWLDKAADWGYRDAELVRWDDDLASLREEDRFRNAVSRMGTPAREGANELAAIQSSHAERCCVDAAIDSTARFLAVGWTDGFVSLLEARSGREVRRWRFGPSAIWAITFLPDGERIATLDWDGILHAWKVDGDPALKSGRAIAAPVEGDSFGWPFGSLLEVAPSGKRILVGGRDRGASLWTSDVDRVRSWETVSGGYFSVRMVWSSDGNRIAAPQGSSVLFFDGETGEPVEAPLQCPSETHSVAFHPAGELLATGHEEGYVRIWHLPSREIIYADFVESIFGVFVAEVEFSPDGRWLAYTSAPGTYLALADVASRRRVWISGHRGGRMGEPSPIRWRADSKRVWSAFTSGVMPVFDDELGTPVKERLLLRGRPPRLSSAGRGVVTHPSGVSLLDTATGDILWHRHETRKGAILQAPTGHFACDFDELDDLVVYPRIGSDEGKELASLARVLFDPKRVRAAQAGVRLVTVDF